jgi:hypothetical protein
MASKADDSADVFVRLREQERGIYDNYYAEYAKKNTKPRGLSPRVNYTDRATATCRRG